MSMWSGLASRGTRTTCKWIDTVWYSTCSMGFLNAKSQKLGQQLPLFQLLHPRYPLGAPGATDKFTLFHDAMACHKSHLVATWPAKNMMPSLVLNGAHCSSGTCVTCCVLLGCLNMLKQTCWSGSPKLTVSVTTVKLLPRLLTHHESEGYGSKPCMHWWTSKFWCMTGCSFMPFPSTYVFICFTHIINDV